eukprot:252555_1
MLLFCSILVINMVNSDISNLPKVIYSNDNGKGCEGDNPQAMVHTLYISNDIDLKLIIGSGTTNCAKINGTNIDQILDILDLYEKDYYQLNKSSVENGYNPYPTPEYLRSITIQGANSSTPKQGYYYNNNSLNASKAIINVINNLDNNEYIYYGAGAGLGELSQALHDNPNIVNKVRLYSIGKWNTKQDPYSRQYIYNNFVNKSDKIWWIESNITFHGIWDYGNQTGNYSDYTFDSNIISHSGNLGSYYSTIKPNGFPSPAMKEGDMPAFFYVFDPMHRNRNISNPMEPNWGGQYKNYFQKTLYWSDLDQNNANNISMETIFKWRIDYLNDWKVRLQWLYNHTK